MNGRNFAASANFANEGALTIGAGSMFSVPGDFSQAATAALTVEINGINSGEFGEGDITGEATLDGTLNAEFVEGFAPADGNNFQVVTYGSRVGEFTVNAMNLPVGLELDLVHGATELTLQVITAPLPAGVTPTILSIERNDVAERYDLLTSLSYTLSGDVGSSIAASDLVLVNETTDTPVDLTGAIVSWNPATNTARWDLTGASINIGFHTAIMNTAGVDPIESMLLVALPDDTDLD